MKTIICSIVLFIATALGAQAQSIECLMRDADLVVAGEVVNLGYCDRFEIFSVSGAEVLHGSSPGGEIRVALFTDLCCHVCLEPEQSYLLFLNRLHEGIEGLEYSGPVYTVRHGELTHIRYDEQSEKLLLDATRMYAESMDRREPEEHARNLAALYQEALELDFEPLLYSAAWDMISHPEAKELLDTGDAALTLERFGRAERAGRLRHRLLLLLGDLQPSGFLEELESLVRSVEGRVFIDSSTAMLRAFGTAESLTRLTAEFDGITGTGQENVLHVLGSLGNGRGIAALESLLAEHGAELAIPFIDALMNDRSDHAAQVLGRMVRDTDDTNVASAAIEALAWINSSTARAELEALAGNDDLGEAINEQAAALLAALSR